MEFEKIKNKKQFNKWVDEFLLEGMSEKNKQLIHKYEKEMKEDE